ncbi:MAG TPA: polymer-forming cytoskeletal protein [Gemmatimonadales bacterium]|jgi:cytoskeletal protein CcmA (bactofilin family)
MTIWKEQAPAKKESIPISPAAPKLDNPPRAESAQAYDVPRRVPDREAKESLIASDLTVEGKIEGAGHVRIAGRFKGDVNVQGHLTIEVGAKLTGGVRANTVIIGGELDGNIEAASRVELLETGVLNGDLKAGSLTVAAGSRMRGQVEFGWDEKGGKAALRMESGSAS